MKYDIYEDTQHQTGMGLSTTETTIVPRIMSSNMTIDDMITILKKAKTIYGNIPLDNVRIESSGNYPHLSESEYGLQMYD